MASLRNYFAAQLQADEELKRSRTILGFQAAALATLPVTCVVVMIIQTVWPHFFVYPYLTWSVTPEVLARFWPLFAYAGVMASLTSLSRLSSSADGEILVMDSVTSVLAGLWEELGYRWLFICTGMLGLALSNWLLGSVVGSILVAVLLTLGVFVIFTSATRRNALLFLGGVVLTALAGCWGYVLWVLGYRDPVFWMWRNILLPLSDALSFGTMTSVFHNPAIPTLFVFGALAANIKFRDGHKYQGPVGMVNAWYIGLLMFYATVTYGLGTAIALHALYDLEISFIKYILRKVVGR